MPQRRSSFLHKLATPLVVAALGVATLSGVPAAAAQPAAAVDYPRVPVVSDALTGGLRTGAPWHSLGPDIFSQYDYTETEYFVSGTASNLGRTWSGTNPAAGSAALETADYKTRVVVLRPTDPQDFNGRTVVEWANASATFDLHLATTTAHTHLLEQGYAVVTITAQPISVNSAQGLKAWDPVRYGSLNHPGDKFNVDIFAQIAAAVKDPQIADKMLNGLRTETLIGFGSSQSCERLVPFINVVQSEYPVFDGMLLVVCNAIGLNTSVVKTLLLTGEGERLASGVPGARGPSPAPTKAFRTWQMAGASHVDWDNSSLVFRNIARDQSSGTTGTFPTLPPFDYETAYQYGELPPPASTGTCVQSSYPQRFVFAAGLEALSAWVKGGPAPKDLRLELAADGQVARDQYGNALGGYRLPVVDVPIAEYDGDACGLNGLTRPFDSAQLASLYSSHSDYVKKMQKATTQAVAHRLMTAADGCELMTRAVRSSIGGTDVYDRPIPQCGRG